MLKNENGHYRGLHIVIIDHKTGKVASAWAFDTYRSSQQLETFIQKNIPEGYIVAIACKDDCATTLS